MIVFQDAAKVAHRCRHVRAGQPAYGFVQVQPRVGALDVDPVSLVACLECTVRCTEGMAHQLELFEREEAST